MANFKLLKRTPTKETPKQGKATLIFDEEKMFNISDSFSGRTRAEGDAKRKKDREEAEAKKKK